MVINNESKMSRATNASKKRERHMVSNHFALAGWNMVRGILRSEIFPNGLFVDFDGPCANTM